MKAAARLMLQYLRGMVAGEPRLQPILRLPLSEEARDYLLNMEVEWQVALLEHCLELPPGKYPKRNMRREP
jgi:hypothetical protein